MFDNVGDKIKGLAKALCWIGISASVVYAIVLWMQNSYRNPTVALGIGILVGGCCVSWISSLCLYGFGELIEETQKNRRINHTLLYIVAKVASGEQVKVNVKLEE